MDREINTPFKSLPFKVFKSRMAVNNDQQTASAIRPIQRSRDSFGASQRLGSECPPSESPGKRRRIFVRSSRVSRSVDENRAERRELESAAHAENSRNRLMILEKMVGLKGSEAAGIDFDAAVEQFYEALFQFAFSLSGNASDAADLTQETYRVLLLKAGQIRDPQKLKSWLFTTLYREFLKGRGHLSRFPEVELDEATVELPVVNAAGVDELDSTAVLSALQGLEEKYRAPVALFYLDDLSYKEIAQVLDVPIGTVMSRLARGKGILRQRLSELFSTHPGEPITPAEGNTKCPPPPARTNPGFSVSASRLTDNFVRASGTA